MASPEEFRIEQKTRALKLKEEALSRQAQNQMRTEKRLITHQEDVAQKERANRLKAQELVKREHKLADEKCLLDKENESLLIRQNEMNAKKKSMGIIVLPLLLIVCVIGGYLAFDYMSQQKIQYNQIALASKNIDKLANILNMTQEQVMDKSSALQNKKVELDKTKSMLVDLKSTSDQLQTEIIKLKDTSQASQTEKEALSSSADILVLQLSELKTQLDDNYLTIDINEALIDYQEHDIETFKTSLAEYKKKLDLKEGSLNEQQAKQDSLNALLASSKAHNKTLSVQLKEMQQSLKDIQSQLKQMAKENRELTQQNLALSNKLNKFFFKELIFFYTSLLQNLQ